MVATLFKLGASMAAIFSALAVAVPTATADAPLAKRAAGPSCLSSSGLQSLITEKHTAHREYHHANGLVWDDKLAQYAQDWVNGCKFEHSGGPYGENLYAVYPGPMNGWNQATTDALDSWVYEVDKYSYDNPGFSEATGHYTAFIWKNSKRVGCAWNTVDCDGKAIFACEYDPCGNVEGQYEKNVLAP